MLATPEVPPMAAVNDDTPEFGPSPDHVTKNGNDANLGCRRDAGDEFGIHKVDAGEKEPWPGGRIDAVPDIGDPAAGRIQCDLERPARRAQDHRDLIAPVEMLAEGEVQRQVTEDISVVNH